jgi:hypothetical protein
MEDTMGSIPIMAYEIRTKASMQTMIMRWVFSPRGFRDEDNDSLVAGNCEVRWRSSAFSGNSEEFVEDGFFLGGKALGLSSRGSSGRPAVLTLGSPVSMQGQSKDVRQ